MSAPKFAVGDVVWQKTHKTKVLITKIETYSRGDIVEGWRGCFRAATSGWWYRFEGAAPWSVCAECMLSRIPDSSEWSFTDLMEEIKSGSGVDA